MLNLNRIEEVQEYKVIAANEDTKEFLNYVSTDEDALFIPLEELKIIYTKCDNIVIIGEGRILAYGTLGNLDEYDRINMLLSLYYNNDIRVKEDLFMTMGQ